MGKAGVKIILGIDPGTNTTGYGVIEVRGSVVRCVILGVIDLHQLKDPYRKLHHIFERVCALVDEYGPHEVALESPFFGNNVQSMLKLGRAQGVAMAAALSKGCPAPGQAGDYGAGGGIEGAGCRHPQKHAEIGGVAQTARCDRRTGGCGMPPLSMFRHCPC